MKTQKLPVVICGASGRMGKELMELCGSDPNIQLVGACVRSSSPLFGQEVGGVRVTNSLDDALRETLTDNLRPVIIDFSSADALFEHSDMAMQLNVPLLVGVSGVHEEHRAHLAKVSQNIPVLLAPNTSMAANLLTVLAGFAAKILEDADVEICETHHRYKKDSPSGLAYQLAEHIAQARDTELATAGCFNRNKQGERKAGEIGVFGLRGGNVIGTHTVNLFDEDETLELTHRVSNRRVFAIGALKAARFLVEQPPGLYNMLNVFKIDELLSEKHK